MEAIKNSEPQIIYTNKARCRDCYRCVRMCPVKAIRMENSQASVDPQRCVLCGTCINECPQEAKSYQKEYSIVREWIAAGETVVATVAPSFAALLDSWETSRFPSALRKLGFNKVAETAEGAHISALASLDYLQAEQPERALASACPAAVRLIEKYHPEAVKELIPVQSPMVIHGKMLKEKYGSWSRVVFIGPCVAKKAEALLHPDSIDAALTFEELFDWLADERISLQNCEESGFDDPAPSLARLYPLQGGMLKTAGLQTEPFSENLLSVTGYDEITQLLESCSDASCIAEPLFCKNGCINGPVMQKRAPLFNRRYNLLRYQQKEAAKSCESQLSDRIEYRRYLEQFQPNPKTSRQEITEEEIRAVLVRTGKGNPEDQLNCGACGYDNCRDKAVAVLRGMAEEEMCLPQMRRLAEQRSDKIIESTPNGVIILDHTLKILTVNPAFRRMFRVGESILGRPISEIMDPEPFENLMSSPKEILEKTVSFHNPSLVCHQILYKMPGENQMVGIFVDITGNVRDRRQLDSLRSEIVLKAQELLDHQVQMAQTLAKALGENTARGEELVEHLMHLARQDSLNGFGRESE
ncbi:MAG: [Fe-Fe] hydrogenase large subunit C-terminal domain-containing protein [Calditrichia bacterium]